MYERECDLCGATKRTVIEPRSERYICKACPSIGRTTLPPGQRVRRIQFNRSPLHLMEEPPFGILKVYGDFANEDAITLRTLDDVRTLAKALLAFADAKEREAAWGIARTLELLAAGYQGLLPVTDARGPGGIEKGGVPI